MKGSILGDSTIRVRSVCERVVRLFFSSIGWWSDGILQRKS